MKWTAHSSQSERQSEWYENKKKENQINEKSI